MQLSVIILNYEVRYFLELCLRSVTKAIDGLEAEIIVIDNNSRDESCNMVAKEFPQVQLIRNQENTGFAKGNNKAVKQAKGEYICFLNPDMVIAEDTFTKLINHVLHLPDLGAAGIRLIDGSGNFLPESKRNIPYPDVAIKKLFGSDRSYYADHLDEKDSDNVEILVGAFLFMKRTVFEEIGGFDEDYFMYGEDIDLSYRLLKSGYKNYYLGEITAIHFKGESTSKNKAYTRRFYGAMRVFYKKHFRKNWFFDAIVGTGLEIVHVFKRKPKLKSADISRYVLVSDIENPELESLVSLPFYIQANLENIKDGSGLIFDANFMDYKAIISAMQGRLRNRSCTFKIIPDKAHFMIGSDNPQDRGEVVVLSTN